MKREKQPRNVLDGPAFTVRDGGVLRTVAAVPLATRADIGAMYVPAVAQVAEAIRDGIPGAGDHSWASNLVLVVSDGTATLGLGDTGPSAALPVMESKAAILSHFGGFNAVPLVLDTKSNEKILATLKVLRPSFAAVNIEDVAAPRCFELEEMLADNLRCPVMHDDQHGTAIAVLAALHGALTVTGRRMGTTKVVISGAGAAGTATAKILLKAGIEDLVVTDSHGILFRGRSSLTDVKFGLAASTNQANLRGGQMEALKGADVYIGLSPAHLTVEEVRSMAADPIVFALSNPSPQIDPTLGSRISGIFATSLSGYPNQIINVLASPGVFSGALRAGAGSITEDMKLAAAAALTKLAEPHLRRTRILPDLLEPGLTDYVAQAVELASRNRMFAAS